MSAPPVSLFPAQAIASAAGSHRGRGADDSGSLFEAALAMAGEAVRGESGAPAEVAGEGGADGSPEETEPDLAAAILPGGTAGSDPLTSPAIPLPQTDAASDAGGVSQAFETADASPPTATASVAAGLVPATDTAATATGAAANPDVVDPGARGLSAPPAFAASGTVSGGSARGVVRAEAPAVRATATSADAPVTVIGASGSAAVEAAAEASVSATPPDPRSPTLANPGASTFAADAAAARQRGAESAEVVSGPQGSSAAAVSAPGQTHVAATAPTVGPDPAAAAPRAVAAQVSPVVVSIAQRPAGTHQLTMTVNPESLGPVTVRAHIAADGQVQVELLGATDAGREALRTIVSDLRRDLAAVMPHASLSLTSGTGADASSHDRGLPPGAGERSGDHPGGDRRAPGGDAAPRSAPHLDANRVVPTLAYAVGDGLDILV